MATFNIYPQNDFGAYVKSKEISATNGSVTTQSSGNVVFFLSASGGAYASAANASLAGTAVYVSGKGWLCFLDRVQMNATALASHFGSTAPYLVVDDGEGWRVYYEGTYADAREGS